MKKHFLELKSADVQDHWSLILTPSHSSKTFTKKSKNNKRLGTRLTFPKKIDLRTIFKLHAMLQAKYNKQILTNLTYKFTNSCYTHDTNVTILLQIVAFSIFLTLFELSPLNFEHNVDAESSCAFKDT